MTATRPITNTIPVPYTPPFRSNLVNTATVTPPTGFTDGNTANNTATDTDKMRRAHDRTPTKTNGRMPSSAGKNDTYTIVVSNSGPSTVIGATVGDSLPRILRKD